MRVPFDIPAGLISDETATAAGPAWWDADKVRFWRGRPQTIGGWERFNATLLTGVCRNLFTWDDKNGDLNVAAGTHSKLQLAYGGALFDITPSGLAAGNIDGVAGSGYGTGSWSGGVWSAPSGAATYPRTWALSKYGQNLIANPRGGAIYQWFNNTAAVAVAVTNAPAQVMYALVTEERQLLAFGCNEEVSGVFNPLCIRGSDIENVNNWTTTSTDNAFEHILEGGGHIVAAGKVGQYLFIWTDTAVHLGQFIGDADQTYRFECLGQRCGLVGPNAFVISGQTAFWVGTDLQFYRCGLGGQPSIVVSPLQSELQNNLAPSQQEKIVLHTVSVFGEVWVHYPDSRDGGENSRYISVGTTANTAGDLSTLVEGVWSKGTLARTAFVDASPFQFPIAVDPLGVVYLHERGHSADGGPFSWYIESAAQTLGAGDRIMTLKGMWPDFKDQVGPVQLTVYTRKYPQSADRVKGPYTIAVGQTKCDFMASGRMIRTRIAGNANPTFSRFGKPSFDVDTAGLQ